MLVSTQAAEVHTALLQHPHLKQQLNGPMKPHLKTFIVNKNNRTIVKFRETLVVIFSRSTQINEVVF